MNKNCKLCDGEYDFSNILVSPIFDKIGISFAGNSTKPDNETRFRFCPLCGKELTAQNFGETFCEYYHTEYGFGQCWGQKNAPICWCNGDKLKCEVRGIK